MSKSKRFVALTVLTILLGVTAYCLMVSPSKATSGSQSEPIMDLSLIGSIEVSDNIYLGYPMTVSYVLPSLPGRSIENITLQVEYDSTMHTLYNFNRTTATLPPNSSFVWTPTFLGSASGFVLDVLVLNLTDGRWYADEDRRSITPMIASGMVGAANATPSENDNSGMSRSSIAWTVYREMAFIDEMEFNLFNNDEGSYAFSQDKDMSYLYADPDNFTASEGIGRVDFEFKWTIPRDQSPGEYALNVTASDLNGYTESWNGWVTNISWDQRPPVLQNGTIFMEEDTPIEVDMMERFKEVNDEGMMFFIGPSDPNLTLHLSGSILSLAPDEDWYGDADITIFVDDGSSNLSYGLSAVVSPINDPPYPSNGSIVIDWNTETMIIFANLFFDPEGDHTSFAFIRAGPHLEAVYDQAKAQLSVTPEDGWTGSSFIIVNATDGMVWDEHNISVEVMVPEYFLSLSVVFESAGDHIPAIPPSLRPARIVLSSGLLNYSIVVTEFESRVLSVKEGTYDLSIEILIPSEFTYNKTQKRSGYQAPIIPGLVVSSDKALPFSIHWSEFVEEKAAWDDIDFEGTFMNRTDGEWAITVPVSTNRTGYSEIHLKLVVINDPDKNETLHFDLFWDDGKRAYILELKKNDLKEFEEGELSYYFTDGTHRTPNDQTVFITEDSAENSIVVIAILVVLIVLVMVALVLIMRKPSDEEDMEMVSQEASDRSCPSCGERASMDELVCPNCKLSMEE
jgi:hypothetical protein